MSKSSYPKAPPQPQPQYVPQPHGQAPGYPGAPPPYTPHGVPPPQYPNVQYQYGLVQGQLPAGQPYIHMQSQQQPQMMGAPPPYAPAVYAPNVPNPNPGYPVQSGFNYGAYGPGATVMANYDSGARFDGIAQHGIPPAPPGCAPNAAQLAQAQGGSVVMKQTKAGWFSGGSGGGCSWDL